jgi:hypothetical protein
MSLSLLAVKKYGTPYNLNSMLSSVDNKNISGRVAAHDYAKTSNRDV